MNVKKNLETMSLELNAYQTRETALKIRVKEYEIYKLIALKMYKEAKRVL